MFTRDPNPHPHPRPLPAPAHATSTRESRPATFRHTLCIRACLSCNCNIQVFPSILRLLTYIHSPHKNLSRKERRTPICLTCQVAKMLEGHTIRRILPPIIDDVDKYQFAILGNSLRSLGLRVSLGLTRKKLAKRK